MVNKKSMWFVSLFSLIVIMFTVYTSMPKLESEINDDLTKVSLTESNYIMALKVQYEEETMLEINSLQKIMLDESKSNEERNSAYDEIKGINQNKATEESIESLIKKNYDLESFVKIKYDQIKVTINSKDHNYSLANKIMNDIQKLFEEKKYICIKFES